MVDWKATTLQIVLPILSSGLIISTFATFYNEIYNKPYLQIDAKINNVDKRISTIVVTNPGRAPAKNILLTVAAPQHILEYNIFTTENITFNNLKDRYLQLYLPRFVQGNGAMMKIVLLADVKKNINLDHYNVYATSDQGSIKVQQLDEHSISTDPMIRLLIDEITTSTNFFFFLFGIILGAMWLIWRFLRKRKKTEIIRFVKYIKVINAVYSTLHHNKEQCMKSLAELQIEVTEMFKKGIISDSTYDALNGKILMYVSLLEHKGKSLKEN